MSRTYVAISPNIWGKGETFQSAKDTLREFGGSLTKHIVYLMPEGATNVYVDPMGSLHWEWEDGADTSGKVEIITSKGVKL